MSFYLYITKTTTQECIIVLVIIVVNTGITNLIIFKRIKPNIISTEQSNKYFFRTKLNMSSIE